LGLEFVKKGITEELQTLREKLRSTEQALEMETAALETEKKKTFFLQVVAHFSCLILKIYLF
jgi:hypothetical protein